MSAVQNDTLKINHCVNRAAPVSIYRDWPASLITILCVSFTNSATVERLKQVQLCNRLIDQSADNITGLKCVLSWSISIIQNPWLYVALQFSFRHVRRCTNVYTTPTVISHLWYWKDNHGFISLSWLYYSSYLHLFSALPSQNENFHTVVLTKDPIVFTFPEVGGRTTLN